VKLIVTTHAVQRWMERIGAENEGAALAILTGPGVRHAIAFGAQVVRIGKARIIIDYRPDETEQGAAVIKTVLLADLFVIPAQLRPVSMGGVPPVSARFSSKGDPR